MRKRLPVSSRESCDEQLRHILERAFPRWRFLQATVNSEIGRAYICIEQPEPRVCVGIGFPIDARHASGEPEEFAAEVFGDFCEFLRAVQ